MTLPGGVSSHPRNMVEAVYRHFADYEAADYSPLYAELSRAVADDPELIDFVSRRPVVQANLFLSAIQYLTGLDALPRSSEALRDFVLTRGDDVADVMRVRRTQTNEVGRCAALLPALPDGPLALLEVGASAGLCLLLDKFFYDYGAARVGDPASSVRLRCRAYGLPPLPGSLPEVVWRSGLDLSPIDVRSNDDIRWLLACVWPEHAERRARLAAAIDLARRDPPRVRRGDMLTDLPSLIAEVSRDATLVVFHSAALVYVAPEERVKFVETLMSASHDRTITWISNESPGVVDGLPARATRLSVPKGLQKAVARTRLEGGRRVDELLAIAQSHGAELEWIGA